MPSYGLFYYEYFARKNDIRRVVESRVSGFIIFISLDLVPNYKAMIFRFDIILILR